MLRERDRSKPGLEPGLGIEPEAGDRRLSLRIFLLGHFRVGVGPTLVRQGDWPLSKAAALVKILALQPGFRMHREQMIDMLWPESGFDKGTNSFHRALHAARSVLRSLHPSGKFPELILTRGTLELQPEPFIWTDVVEFERLVAIARSQPSTEHLDAAITHYEDDLLIDDLYSDWASLRREQLRNSFIGTLSEAANLAIQQGAFERAIGHLLTIVSRDPYNEVAQLHLIQLFALTGSRHRALQHIREYRQVLIDELRIEPSPDVEKLYRALLDGTAGTGGTTGHVRNVPQEASYAKVSKKRLSGNLPASVTSFVGRERELDELSKLIGSQRLVTLIGPGGIGKSRLAIEYATRSLASYPDGAWIVELAGLDDPDLLSQGVVDALDIPENRFETPYMTLYRWLEPRKLLLILDNCEHLTETVAKLADSLLQSNSDLTILVTSREPLRAEGEFLWQVPPLIRGLHSENASEDANLADAVILFNERAKQAHRDFSPVGQDGAAVHQICQRLDGIPLAIELAAAQVSFLSPPQLADRLDDALAVLSGGPRTAPTRQQTMDAAISWSYDRLPRHEQWLFRQLSVFAGGFAAETVEFVTCAQPVISDTNWLQTLKNLVDKSLVLTFETELCSRYRIPEPVRQFGIRVLTQQNEIDDARLRQFSWCLRLAEHASEKLGQGVKTTSLVPLDDDFVNIRAALFWSIGSSPDPGAGLRLASSLWRFFEVRGRPAEGKDWVERALARGADASAQLRAQALHAAGNLARDCSDFPSAILYHESSLEIRKQLGDLHGIAHCYNNLGAVYRDTGDYERTLELCLESARLFRQVGDTLSEGISLLNLGIASRILGSNEQAVRFFEESLKSFRALEDEQHIGSVLVHLARIELARGELVAARMYVSEALLIQQPLEVVWGQALGMMVLGRINALEGHRDGARKCFAESVETLHSIGARHHLAQDLVWIADFMHETGRTMEAAQVISAAAAILKETGVPIPPSEQADYDKTILSLQADLGLGPFKVAWASGQVLAQQRAVNLVLEILKSARHP